MGMKPNPDCDSTSLGSILLTDGAVKPEQLDAALSFQKNNEDLLLGEALVHMGIISRELLEVALVKQELLRNGTSKASHVKVQRLLKMATQQTLAFGGSLEAIHQLVVELADKVKP